MEIYEIPIEIDIHSYGPINGTIFNVNLPVSKIQYNNLLKCFDKGINFTKKSYVLRLSIKKTETIMYIINRSKTKIYPSESLCKIYTIPTWLLRKAIQIHGLTPRLYYDSLMLTTSTDNLLGMIISHSDQLKKLFPWAIFKKGTQPYKSDINSFSGLCSVPIINLNHKKYNHDLENLFYIFYGDLYIGYASYKN